ncbi:D-glycero-beta-D-manno-heptose-7-phosphate kinase, partial [Candidatus Micrarchaeota archaeon]|nr:D-glycero-beta-D-manno-heptose-7-phosphate kinase [Candidatus Micrarchaeota archaeon]
KGKKILVIGDLMIDQYIVGEVERISPEAPVPVLKQAERRYGLGGAANTANNIAALNGETFIAGAIGKDKNGERLKRLLKEKRINVEGVIEEEKRITTCKTRIIAGTQQLARIDDETTELIKKNTEEKLLRYFKEKIPLIDAVIVSDYNKGLITNRIVRELMKEAGRNKKIVCVDSKNFIKLGFRNASCLKPNKKELEKETEIELNNEKNIINALRVFQKKLSPESILLTMGRDGMSLWSENRFEKIPSFAREVFDVSGAGDTVLATFSISLASNANVLEAATIANYAAGIVVGKLGATTVSVEELKKAIS